MFHSAFHLSLTVLVHYRSLTLFSLGGWFPQIPTGYVPHGTWDTPRGNLDLNYRGFTFFGQLFQVVLLSKLLPDRSPATPREALAGKVGFRLLRFRSPLLTQSPPIKSGLVDFSSTPYLDVSVRVVPS